jgi:aspartyl-tRNA(Asn)/glutamyl-tRNA(Gln) amidotransferase subunit B
MIYEVVVGVEVHAQLRTTSKMFCGCGTAFGAPPNSQTCPVCLGLPGSLPVINKTAVEMAVRAGVALNCTIAASNRFARKNYFYPDLPKGYQISQYEAPICENGWIEIPAGEGQKRVRIRRAHLEEDAGKNVHDQGTSGSLVDLNRAGTPLLEIVTEPDMRSADEVVAYVKGLRDILMYLEVCDGNMEEGSFRCEPNLSLRPLGQKDLGTKVELKNINSFKFVKDAIEYEIKRQTKVLNEGGRIQQETRLWNFDRSETAVMRSKEEAHDYRYFPDPDLVPLKISSEWVDELRKTVPELPATKQARLKSRYGLSDYIATVLTADRHTADFFEATMASAVKEGAVSEIEIGAETANWIIGDLRGLQKKTTTEITITPEALSQLVVMTHSGKISGPTAKRVLEKMVAFPHSSPSKIVDDEGLAQVSDEGDLLNIIEAVIERNPSQVAQYRSGKEQVLGFFVGQVMKASGGKANPGKVNELLKKKLGA